MILGAEKTGKIDIPTGEETKLKSGLFFGFGKTKIHTIIHGKAGKVSTGYMIGPFLLNIK